MKRLLLFFGFTVLMQTHRAFAQDSASKLAVVVSPALFVPVSVAAQGGIQIRISRRLTLLAESAFSLFEPDNTGYEKIRYWRTGLEFRYYLLKKAVGRYVALQNNYLFRELTNTMGGNYYTRDRTFTYSKSHIKSPVLSSALKVGLELPLGKLTFIDVFAGAGVRFVFNRYKTESALVTSIEPQRQHFFKFDDAWLYNYTLMRPHITGGFRFGIRL